MPKGRGLTPEQCERVYTMHCMGESRQDIADAFGIVPNTVTNIVRRQRKLHEKEDELAARECVVAGNRKAGRLMSTSDPHRYDGSCIIDGKAHTKSFVAVNATAATNLWNDWCTRLRDEKAFMDMVERKSDHIEHEASEPEVVTDEVEVVEGEHMGQEESGIMIDPQESIYIIWAKGERPKLFGAYLSIDAALDEIDRLNEVASFLVNDAAFEVEEVGWRI